MLSRNNTFEPSTTGEDVGAPRQSLNKLDKRFFWKQTEPWNAAFSLLLILKCYKITLSYKLHMAYKDTSMICLKYV